MATFTWLYFVLGLVVANIWTGWMTGWWRVFQAGGPHVSEWVYIFFYHRKPTKPPKWCCGAWKQQFFSTCKIILKKNATSVQQGTSWKSTQRFWEHLQQLPVVPSRLPCFVLAGLHGATFGCWLHVNWYSLFSSGVTVARLKIVRQIRHRANPRSDGCRKREASVKKKESE